MGQIPHVIISVYSYSAKRGRYLQGGQKPPYFCFPSLQHFVRVTAHRHEFRKVLSSARHSSRRRHGFMSVSDSWFMSVSDSWFVNTGLQDSNFECLTLLSYALQSRDIWHSVATLHFVVARCTEDIRPAHKGPYDTLGRSMATSRPLYTKPVNDSFTDLCVASFAYWQKVTLCFRNYNFKGTNFRQGIPVVFNPLKAELNPICYLLALLGAHHFLHVSRIRVKSLILRLLMLYIYGAPILDVSRSHTTTQHSR